ncbi:MAG: hypothetical protein KDD55_11460, partial [Bdellovibrionales bacterium]|nr:hypothetical protein [Bdellovibrionales bacterium]
LARTFASFELGSPEAHGTSHVITYIQSFREGNPSGDYTFAISSGKPSYIELTLPTTREMTLHSPDGNGIFLLTLEAGDYRFPLLDQAVCAYVENWVNSSYPLGIGGKEDISEISR